MLVKLNAEKQYCLNEPRLPDGLCNRKNKVLLAGRMCSEVEYEEEVCRFSVRLEYGDETVEVLAEKDLFDLTGPEKGGLLVIDGEFRTYYRKLRKYRPLIKVFARHMIPVESKTLEAEKGESFHPNRVYLEGVIEDNPVLVTTLNGTRTLKALILCGGIEIPCSICEEAADLEKIQKDDRYQLWGRVTTRRFQKRLGKGRFETDAMNEVLVSDLQRIVAQSIAFEERGAERSIPAFERELLDLSIKEELKVHT